MLQVIEERKQKRKEKKKTEDDSGKEIDDLLIKRIDEEAIKPSVMRKNPTNQEIIMASKYLLQIRKHINNSKKQKVVCQYCAKLTTKINIHRHLQLVHFVSQKKAKEIKKILLMSYNKIYNNLTFKHLIVMLREAFEMKLETRIQKLKSKKNTNSQCFLCKENMHKRSIIRHTNRHHEEFLLNSKKVKCTTCEKWSKSILYHMLKKHIDVYSKFCSQEKKQLTLIDRSTNKVNKNLKIKKREFESKIDQQTSVDHYLNYRESNFSSQSKKNLKQRERIITNFLQQLKNNNFTIDIIFNMEDPTNFMNALKQYIEQTYDNVSSRSMAVIIIEGYMEYISDIRKERITKLLSRSMKDLKRKYNQEKNKNYRDERIKAINMIELDNIVCNSRKYWLETVRKSLLDENSLEIYDRTDIYGGLILNLCYTNGLRTSDIVNFLVQELDDAIQIKNHWIIKIMTHKTSDIYGGRIVVVETAEYKALQRITQMYKPESRYVFKSREGLQLTVPNTLKYLYSYQDRRDCSKRVKPKDFRDAITETAIRNEMKTEIAYILKHSTSTQNRSYAPRSQFEKEVEGLIKLNKLREEQKQNVGS